MRLAKKNALLNASRPYHARDISRKKRLELINLAAQTSDVVSGEHEREEAQIKCTQESGEDAHQSEPRVVAPITEPPANQTGKWKAGGALEALSSNHTRLGTAVYVCVCVCVCVCARA